MTTTRTCQHIIVKLTNQAFGHNLGVCKDCGSTVSRPTPSRPAHIEVTYHGDRERDAAIAATSYVNGIAERARGWFAAAHARQRTFDSAAYAAVCAEAGAFNTPHCDDCELDMIMMVPPNSAVEQLACPECGLTEVEQEFMQAIA